MSESRSTTTRTQRDVNPIDRISPGVRCKGILFDCTVMARSRGGNGIVANNNPALFMMRMVVRDPYPDVAPPINGTVTAAMGPPLGHPATNVVVVLDSNRNTSAGSPTAPVGRMLWCIHTVST